MSGKIARDRVAAPVIGAPRIFLVYLTVSFLKTIFFPIFVSYFKNRSSNRFRWFV